MQILPFINRFRPANSKAVQIPSLPEHSQITRPPVAGPDDHLRIIKKPVGVVLNNLLDPTTIDKPYIKIQTFTSINDRLDKSCQKLDLTCGVYIKSIRDDQGVL